MLYSRTANQLSSNAKQTSDKMNVIKVSITGAIILLKVIKRIICRYDNSSYLYAQIT